MKAAFAFCSCGKKYEKSLVMSITLKENVGIFFLALPHKWHLTVANYVSAVRLASVDILQFCLSIYRLKS